MSDTLLPSARLAAWGSAWLRGEAVLDDVLGRLGPGHHVLVGLPDSAGAEPLAIGLGALRARGAAALWPALPVPGDPIGLAGPTDFTAAALEAGEAVLAPGTGLGLIPVMIGGATEWRCRPAADPPWVDLAEAGVRLRQVLLEVTARLAELDVATWQPAVPDALMNLRHRRPVALPPGYHARRVETVERALLCREIVRLAGEAGTGALSAGQEEQCRQALAELDRAARHALVAACR